MIEYYKNLSLENLPYINEEGLICWEEFKDIPDYEGFYQVSDLGRVKSLNYRRTKIEKILKLNINKNNGYLLIRLSNCGVTKTKEIHKLVAMAFLDHFPCGYTLVVNHKNFNRVDSRAENLEIISTRENTNKLHLKNTSSYTGVSYEKHSGLWRSQIVIGGKSVYLGKSLYEIEACNLYADALKAVEQGEIIQKKLHNYSSKYKGVSFDKKRSKWVVNIIHNNNQEYLGSFLDEEEASLVYQNALNAIKNGEYISHNRRTKSSKYKGVYWDKNAKKWQARIQINGERIYLGYFDLEIEAYEKIQKIIICGI